MKHPNDDPKFTRLYLKLRRRAARFGAQRCDAEDMAQEALLRLIQRMLHTPVEMPEHYAMTILHNIARAKWRSRVETTELEEDTALTQPLAESRLALQTLSRAIAELPPEQSEVMQLVLQGEFSPRSMAQKLDLPVGTVMSRLARARLRLRAEIGLGVDGKISELM
ncbi:MAG: RNA polymerase sigma factor [Sulfitobacter sp.]